MNVCYYCEYPKQECKRCIHSLDYRSPLDFVEIDKDGDGFICKEQLEQMKLFFEGD